MLGALTGVTRRSNAVLQVHRSGEPNLAAEEIRANEKRIFNWVAGKTARQITENGGYF